MFVMNVFAILFSLLLASSCLMHQKPQAATSSATQDTVVLARNDHTFVLNEDNPVQQTVLKKVHSRMERKENKFILCLYAVKQEKPPEGVYEIYLTTQQPTQLHLQPQSTYFVNVLDAYTLQANSAPQKLCIKLPENAAQPVRDSAASSYFVTLLFRGNILPDQHLSTHAGILRVQKIELMQLR